MCAASTDYQKHHQIHRFCATAAPRCSTAAQPSAAKKAAISSVIMAAKPKLKMIRVAVHKSVEDPIKVEKAVAERKIEGHKTEQTARSKRVEATKKKKVHSAVEATKTARTSAKQSTGGGVAPVQKAGQAQAASAKPVGRWQTPLARLKDRLAELETKLHATQVLRLLALLVKKHKH